MSQLDDLLYPNVQKNWDDRIFSEVVKSHLGTETIVLDIGSGAGIIPAMNFRGLARVIYGIDLDPRVTSNPYLDIGQVGSAEELPFADEMFDVIFANNVMEHLEFPEKVFAEIFRVLKPGGKFFMKTPNRYHYVPLIARLTPLSFHKTFNRLRGRAEEDSFHTFYRANSSRQIRKLAQESGLSVSRIEHIEGRPEYLRFSVPTYLLGFVYERFVNSLEALRHFRVVLIAGFTKPSYQSEAVRSQQP